MAIIQVTPDSLRAEANKLKGLKQQHEQEMKDLRRLILGLNDQWKGAAQDAFLSKYQSLQPEFQKFIRLLQDHINHMETEAKQMEQKDNELSRKMQSFSV